MEIEKWNCFTMQLCFSTIKQKVFLFSFFFFYNTLKTKRNGNRCFCSSPSDCLERDAAQWQKSFFFLFSFKNLKRRLHAWMSPAYFASIPWAHNHGILGNDSKILLSLSSVCGMCRLVWSCSGALSPVSWGSAKSSGGNADWFEYQLLHSD